VLCCSMLQCVAVCCSVLQCVAVWSWWKTSTSAQTNDYTTSMSAPRRLPLRNLQCVAVCCGVLQCVAVCCSVLQCVAVCCSEFWGLTQVTFASGALFCPSNKCAD